MLQSQKFLVYLKRSDNFENFPVSFVFLVHLYSFHVKLTFHHFSFQTHEQSYSYLLASELLSYRDFPLLLYQIGPKFRNELRPRLGLLRSNEFLMKDLYSFDIGPEEAEKTFKKVTDTYDDIFDTLGIKFVKSK